MGSIIAELVDTGEQRDALGRRRTPEERRVQLVQAFKRSGMTMASFAVREGVNYTTFSGWVQRQRQRSPSRRGPVRFTEVKLPVPIQPAGLEVRLPNGMVLRGGTAEELAALVKALRT